MVFLDFANTDHLSVSLSNKNLKAINENDEYVFKIHVASLIQVAYYLSGNHIVPYLAVLSVLWGVLPCTPTSNVLVCVT